MATISSSRRWIRRAISAIRPAAAPRPQSNGSRDWSRFLAWLSRPHQSKRPRMKRGLFRQMFWIQNLAALSCGGGGCLACGAQIVGRRLARTAICHDLVADLLAFTQSSKSGAFDSTDVNEHVVTAVIRLDKAITFGRVKPLYGSHAHGIVPSQDRNNNAHSRRRVRSNFWKGRQR